MEYCGNCGEFAEGRFCRMCGTPVGDVTGLDTQAMAAVSTGYGYEPTQALAAVPAGYGAEPTQVFGGMPTAPVQPPSEFDSLFRSADGGPGMHGQTQMLPPVVETDYRMQPPDGGRIPSARRDPDEDEPRTSRPVVIATVGAVVVAAGVILGLLYLGNQGNTTTAGSTTTTQAGAANASASQAPGVISVPTTSSSPTPSSAPTSAAASTSAGFHGDSLPLGPGSQGSLVKWVQERLKQLGYYQGSVTGSFDQATALAVQQFQAASGVTGDAASTVGAHTRLALEAAGSTPSLRPGTRNADVSRLNQSLDYAESAGLSGSRYTMTTAEAVAFYQQAVGLTPTGEMDASTWAKLQSGTLAGSTFSGGSGFGGN
ncbi:MAG TPA: peptidoglycan-binding domain-containing protein [Actinospica sp.]|jgi:peptidoglycan hydrolase-like protein with peptidoglycan-binding domain|nr:peptidoglycan-binding domain-containing protein [Actinospica sp.]